MIIVAHPLSNLALAVSGRAVRATYYYPPGTGPF